jgi:cytidylate kinase
MKIKYLTIEREYGSGGTEIARRLEESTGISCYGKEMLEVLSKKMHMSIDEIERCEENITGSFMYTLYMMTQASNGNYDMLTKESRIFVEVQAEIQKLAKQGRAIFVGHCASEALKKEEGVIKVFIRCSDDDWKKQRIIGEYGIERAEVDRVRERFDRKRANYYHANTDKKWKDFRNYDIVLDSAVLGVDGCAAMLSGLL